MPVHQNSYYKSIWQPETAGDIILTSEQRFIKSLPDNLRLKFFQTNNEYRRWPGNVVPYVFSDRQTTEQRRKIRKSMDLIQQVAKQFLVVLSFLGGAQEISLPAYCIENGVEIHEMFHALGVNHEHQRQAF
ncbi:Metalloendopeptidase [Aphelenchoides bicaudatus]|nr:Metalloendopeptidase [Aphelenchoides bicaudatus]